MIENKVLNNQNESDDINHLKNQKSISTKVILGQRYKSLSCLYSKLNATVDLEKKWGHPTFSYMLFYAPSLALLSNLYL